jgi:hypothetical protein
MPRTSSMSTLLGEIRTAVFREGDIGDASLRDQAA